MEQKESKDVEGDNILGFEIPIKEIICPKCKERGDGVLLKKRFRRSGKVFEKSYIACANCHSYLKVAVIYILTDKPSYI